VSAEKVGFEVAAQVRAYLESNAAVCEHLADQLLLPMALARGGSFTTLKVSDPTQTNMEVIAKFLPVSFAVENRSKYIKIVTATARR
jgi:RNA 3'-terminal phosphate cyclase (ATP)